MCCFTLKKMGIKSASSDNVLFHTKKMGIKSASSDNATHPQINPNRLEIHACSDCNARSSCMQL